MGEEKASVGPETEKVFLNFKERRNRSANLCGLAGPYDNPIPTRFLAPIDCSTIPAQYI